MRLVVVVAVVVVVLVVVVVVVSHSALESLSAQVSRKSLCGGGSL